MDDNIQALPNEVGCLKQIACTNAWEKVRILENGGIDILMLSSKLQSNNFRYMHSGLLVRYYHAQINQFCSAFLFLFKTNKMRTFLDGLE